MRKLILTLSTAFVFVLHAAAQDRTVTGKVTNDKNAPVEGASVATADGKYGTQTNKDGNYTIILPSTVKALTFSSVNFETTTKLLGAGNTTINISLRATDTKLEEVVVVGYGTQQKKAFTGSAARVNVKEFAQLVTPSIDKQLAGRAAGVDVVNAGGLVNTPARIRIRGYNSISLSADPLIVIDGVPMIDASGSQNLALTTNSNELGDINPSDIESLDVLKDGSATAIYGSRAANGVILITTKKGSRGKTSMNYESSFGFSSIMNKFNLLNAQDFVTIANEKFTNVRPIPLAPPARMDSANTNTDWQDNIFVNNAFVQNQTLSFSGGTQKSSYYLSLNYSSQQGVVRSNKNRSYRARFNVEQEANKFIKFGNNLTLSRQEDYDQTNGSNALSGAVVATLRALPNVAIYSATHPTGYNLLTGGNALGPGKNLQAIDDNYVNIAFILDKNKFYSDKYRILDVAYAELSLFKGFKWRTQFGVDYFGDNGFQGLDPRHGDGFSSGGVAFNSFQSILQTNLQTYFNYNLAIKRHSFYLTGGYEKQQTTTRQFTGQGSNISDLFYLQENIITGSAQTQSIQGFYQKEAFTSMFGRFNYDFDGKYFLQASIRRDGLSSLAPQQRFGLFPGFSVGWRPIKEKFWKSRFISDLKLKASYAEVGNKLSGFRYLSTYAAAPYGNIGGIAVGNVGNANLQWEVSKKTDIGIELGLFKNRLNIIADWFKNDLHDLVLAVPTPLSAGIPGNSILQNIGTAQNHGIELSLNADIIQTKNFNWNLNINYANVTNKVTSLYPTAGVPTKEILTPTIPGSSAKSPYNIIRVGEPVYALYGYQYAGVNRANGNPCYYKKDGSLVQRDIVSGSYYYALDLNDPNYGVITTLNNDDKVILGQSQPKWFGSFTNAFTYKQFGFEFMFRYSGGNSIMNVTRQEVLLNQKFANNGVEIKDRWTTPGQYTSVPKVMYNKEANINQNGEATSRFVEDGDFLRLQNVVLTYNFNKDLLTKFKGYINSVRLFVQCQNVFVWTKYKGVDPESYNAIGFDASVMPAVRTISAGFNIGF